MYVYLSLCMFILYHLSSISAYHCLSVIYHLSSIEAWPSAHRVTWPSWQFVAAHCCAVINHLLPLELLSSYRTETMVTNSHPLGLFHPSPINQLPFYFLPVNLMTPGTSDTQTHTEFVFYVTGSLHLTECPQGLSMLQNHLPFSGWRIFLYVSTAFRFSIHASVNLSATTTPPPHTHPRLQAHLSITGVFLEWWGSKTQALIGPFPIEPSP